MKAAPFDYVAPTTIEEACRLLADSGGGATIIAGGQTLMPLLALRMNQPFILIDINRIPALKGVTRGDGFTRVGAATRQAEALADPLLREHLPIFVTALSNVGHLQTRNRGTIGGSIALGEPAAEMPATAVALGATIELQSVRGPRTVPATDFYLSPYATAIEPDEIVTGIAYPDPPAGSIPLFREVARRPGDFALVGLVGTIGLAGGRISSAGIAWFGMGPTPIRARQVEAALVGRDIAGVDPQAMAEAAIADAAPFDDHHATADYRRTVGRRVFARALTEALDLRVAA